MLLAWRSQASQRRLVLSLSSAIHPINFVGAASRITVNFAAILLAAAVTSPISQAQDFRAGYGASGLVQTDPMREPARAQDLTDP
jgi:hypothetical protein